MEKSLPNNTPHVSMKTLTSQNEFVVGKNDITWIAQSFKDNLYGISFTLKKTRLEMKKLPRAMNDKEILDTLGPASVELGEVLTFLKDAAHELWYLFYVNDAKGNLWAVNANWDDHGWDVGAVAVSDPLRWDAGDRIVSSGFSAPQNVSLSPSETSTLKSRVEKLENTLQAVRKAFGV